MKERIKKIVAVVLVLVILFTGNITEIEAADEFADREAGVIITSNKDTVEIGEELVLSAQGPEKDVCYKYRFSLRKYNQTTVLREYTEEANYTFQAESEGSYDIFVEAQNEAGETIEGKYMITVISPIEIDAEGDKTNQTEEINVEGDEINQTEEIEDAGAETETTLEKRENQDDEKEIQSVTQNVEKEKKKAAAAGTLKGSLTVNKSGALKIGEKIKLTGSHTGGVGKVEYRYTEVYNGVAKTVRGYSDDKEYVYQAVGAGVHKFVLAIRDESGQGVNQTYSVEVIIAPEKKLTGRLSVDKSGTLKIGEKIKLTGSHTGGYGKVEYRYTEVYNGAAKTVRGYSDNGEYVYQAAGVGVHKFVLAIRDESGQGVNQTYSVEVIIAPEKKLTGRLSVDKSGTLKIGEKIKLTGSHTGGYGKVEYRYTEVYNGAAKTVRGYSDNGEYVYQAAGVGVHKFVLAVRDESGQGVNQTYSVEVIIAPEKKLTGKLNADKSGTRKIGETIKLTGNHTGGYGKVEYRYTEVYNGVAKTVQNYSENKEYTYKVTGLGVHKFILAIRDEKGQGINETFYVTATIPEQAVLKANVKSSKTSREYVGSDIVLTTNIAGGYGGEKYRYTEVYNGVATTVQPYSENNTYAFRATKPGVHKYNVAICDKEGQAISVSYSMTVIVHPSSGLSGTFTKNVSGIAQENQNIVLTAAAKGGYGGPYLYRFTETYNGAAKTVQAYSTNNIYKFKIKGNGIHKYTVAIQDCEGQTISLSQTISIGKHGWYYEGGYKYYYQNNKRLEDVRGIIGSQSSYLIKVNKQESCVTVYAKDGNNGYIIPVVAFACSPGAGTPLGTFATQNKYRWWHLYGADGQFCTRITGHILFHSPPYSSFNNRTLWPAEYNRLGTWASQGCVRLRSGDAKWIYDNCSLGTTVVIYNSSVPGPFNKPVYSKIPLSQTWDPTDPYI